MHIRNPQGQHVLYQYTLTGEVQKITLPDGSSTHYHYDNAGQCTRIDTPDGQSQEAFPDYQKVNGVGPQDAEGIRKKTKIDRFKQGGAYHKDYALDPETGRVRGHGDNDAHGKHPHINIKRRDGVKVLINIIGG